MQTQAVVYVFSQSANSIGQSASSETDSSLIRQERGLRRLS